MIIVVIITISCTITAARWLLSIARSRIRARPPGENANKPISDAAQQRSTTRQHGSLTQIGPNTSSSGSSSSTAQLARQEPRSSTAHCSQHFLLRAHPRHQPTLARKPMREQRKAQSNRTSPESDVQAREKLHSAQTAKPVDLLNLGPTQTLDAEWCDRSPRLHRRSTSLIAAVLAAVHVHSATSVAHRSAAAAVSCMRAPPIALSVQAASEEARLRPQPVHVLCTQHHVMQLTGSSVVGGVSCVWVRVHQCSACCSMYELCLHVQAQHALPSLSPPPSGSALAGRQEEEKAARWLPFLSRSDPRHERAYRVRR